MALAFQLDENFSSVIAVGLRLRGIEAHTTADLGLRGASDETQLAVAARSGRILVTHDTDMLVLHSNGFPHAGIVFAPSGARRIGDLVRSLVIIASVLTADDMRNSVEFV